MRYNAVQSLSNYDYLISMIKGESQNAHKENIFSKSKGEERGNGQNVGWDYLNSYLYFLGLFFQFASWYVQ